MQFSVTGLAYGVALAVVTSTAAQATAISYTWSQDVGGNGHRYVLIEGSSSDFQTGVYSWNDANLAALRYSGNSHLATISSAQENQFVQNLIRKGRDFTYWLGGIQDVGALEPSGGWQWIDGTPWGEFTAWRTGFFKEPNNQGGNEYLLEMNADGTWNDAPDIFRRGYIIEVSEDHIAPVPLPASVLFMGAALLGLAGLGTPRRC